MQGIEQITKNINAVNLSIAFFLAFMIVDKIAFWVMKFRGRNGSGQDDTKKIEFGICLKDPNFQLSWEKHKTETHDALGIGIRVEPALADLCKASHGQSAQLEAINEGLKANGAEMKKQTGILEKIRRNGNT